MKILKKLFVGVSVSLVTLQFSCAPTPEPRLQIGQAYAINGVSYQPKIQPNYKEVGKASWYGTKFHKRRTANGDVFDKYELTAAHKTLPLPSVVKVTNLNNGRSINVIVNDRGPFVRGRIIDVSEAAAAELGFKSRGVANVMVELNREASLELMKDPNLRVSEAVKKQIVEAYTNKNMFASAQSQENHQETFLTENTEPLNNNMQVVSNAGMQPLAPASMQQIVLVRKPAANEVSQSKMPTISTANQPSGFYTIQVASTTSEADAKRITTRLKNLSSKIEKANVNGKVYYRVRVIDVEPTNAQIALNSVKSEGFRDAYIIKDNR